MKYAKTWHHRERGRNITKLMARDGCNCGICEQPLDRRIEDELDPLYITFDHIVPISKGGAPSLDNQRLAHARCNRRRGNEYEAPLTQRVVEDSEHRRSD